MAVTALTGWAVGCDPYPKPDRLMYYRAIYEGMPARQEDGSESDAKEFFGTETYNYLSHWHTKRMSSARAEFAGAKNIRGIFNQHHHFTPSLCKTDEAHNAMMAKGRELIKGGFLTRTRETVRACARYQKCCFLNMFLKRCGAVAS